MGQSKIILTAVQQASADKQLLQWNQYQLEPIMNQSQLNYRNIIEPSHPTHTCIQDT